MTLLFNVRHFFPLGIEALVEAYEEIGWEMNAEINKLESSVLERKTMVICESNSSWQHVLITATD
jgi:hypothetical protein